MAIGYGLLAMGRSFNLTGSSSVSVMLIRLRHSQQPIANSQQLERPTSVPQEETACGERDAPTHVAARLFRLNSPQQPQHSVDEQDPAEKQLEQWPQISTAEVQ